MKKIDYNKPKNLTFLTLVCVVEQNNYGKMMQAHNLSLIWIYFVFFIIKMSRREQKLQKKSFFYEMQITSKTQSFWNSNPTRLITFKNIKVSPSLIQFPAVIQRLKIFKSVDNNFLVVFANFFAFFSFILCNFIFSCKLPLFIVTT